jgi:hypothetical protein
MNPTPDLIPHEKFHTGIWLQSVERPSWYYFAERPNDHMIINKDFIESVDEPLKDLVNFLHKKKIKTTPSCSGHNIDERDLEKIFQELKEDSAAIRSRGLKMKDVESGQVILFKDENYKLPWQKRTFLKRVESYQHRGVLGICVGKNARLKEQLQRLDIKGARVIKRGNTVFIFTNEDKQADINAVWKKITNRVKAILR